MSFFLAGRPHGKLDASMAHFRSLRSARAYQRAKATSFVEQVWTVYACPRAAGPSTICRCTWLVGRRGEPGVELPANPVAAAAALRSHWGLGPGPVAHLVRLLESKGIVTVLAGRDEDSTTVDAFSTSRLQRPIIVLTANRANDIYRHRFTAAHELGHLVLHGEVASGDLEQEREADAFAAEFLTPRRSIAVELPHRVHFARLVELQVTWGISVKSLIRRSRELGLISESSATRAYQRLNGLRNEPGFRSEPVSGYAGEQPVMLAKAFELAQKEGLSTAELATELAWSPARIRELLGGQDDRPTLRLVVNNE